MYIITTRDKRKYWTDRYSEENGFLSFVVKSKSGVERRIQLSRYHVSEIVELPDVRPEE